MAPTEPSLEELRHEIDAIDDELHALLMRRTEIVRHVRAAKGNSAALRPGREARVLRRLMAQHRGAFPKPVIVRIWREIMSVFAALQGPFTVAVHAPNGGNDLQIRARDHFGSLTAYSRHESIMGVLRAVSAGRATLGVLPFPASDDEEPWWPKLANGGAATPRIVARVPFASMEPSLPNGVEGLVVALFGHEESGDDQSFLVLETSEEVSRTALSDWLAAADLRVIDVQQWSDGPQQRVHLVQVAGYLASDDARLNGLGSDGEHGIKRWVIGGYAMPLGKAELLPVANRGTD